MRGKNLLALSAVIFAALASTANAQSRAVGGFRHPIPPRVADGPFVGWPGVYVIERQYPVVIEREVVREVAVPVPAEPPPIPRKPYKIGASYDTLPPGCMKMIQDGASFYLCSGEWYRQVSGEGGTKFVAISKP